MRSGKKDIQLLGIIALFLVISSFLHFQFIVPYHISFKEQTQLFLFVSDFLISYLSKPAALICYIGDFLTQFFYLKYGGSFVITLILLIEWLLFNKVLKLLGGNKLTPLWAPLPVISEWILFSNISFSISFPIGTILVLFIFWMYSLIRNKFISALTGIILIPFLYCTAGCSFYLFPLMAIIYDIYNRKYRFLYWIVILALTCILPYLAHNHYLLTLKEAYIYPYPNLISLLGIFMTGGIILLFSLRIIRDLQLTIITFISSIILVIGFLIIGLIKTHDREKEITFGIATEAYRNNWDAVLRLTNKADPFNNIAAYYENIALSNKNLMSDKIINPYRFSINNLFLPTGSRTDWLNTFLSSDVYFHIGDMNMAEYSAMKGIIFSPNNRSSRLLYRLLEINMVNNDVPAAMKYIRMLEATHFHKAAAEEFKKILQDKEEQNNIIQLQNKRNQTFKTDILRPITNYEKSLELLIRDNPDNRIALDYLLSIYLLNKDLPSFFKAYDTYCKNETEVIPKIYTEALLIYFKEKNIRSAKISDYGIAPDIQTEFEEFTRLLNEQEETANPLHIKYPDTYWLYYYFKDLNK